MNTTKPAIQSVGIVGPALSIIVLLANRQWPGLGLTEADLSGVVDLLAGLAGALAGIYGRWKATRQIGGLVKS